METNYSLCALWSRKWNITGDYCAEIARITEGLIEQEGYPLEKHSVVTEDGYINCMYRIPHGKNETINKASRPPVLLSHGITCSSAIFVNQCRLAYFLADQGFDVWLPNNRGTTFSRKHKTLDHIQNKEEYWNFSWHEIAVYDTPAFVDYILECSGFKQLFFIGHSQGATVYAAFASERPEYNEKIALCCLLGPAIIFEKFSTLSTKFVVGVIMPFLEAIHKGFKLPIYEVPFTNLQRITGALSKPNTVAHMCTQYIMSLIAGNANFEQTAGMDYSQFTLTTPCSASMRQVYHYAQIMKNNRFAKYDNGPEENLKLYGSIKPPLYELSKITSPVALFYAKNDMYTHSEDMKKLEEMMGNVVYKHVVANDLFNHSDFLFAKDSISLVYNHVVKIMKEYVPEKST